MDRFDTEVQTSEEKMEISEMSQTGAVTVQSRESTETFNTEEEAPQGGTHIFSEVTNKGSNRTENTKYGDFQHRRGGNTNRDPHFSEITKTGSNRTEHTKY